MSASSTFHPRQTYKVVLFCLSVAGDDERLKKEIGRMTEAFDAMLAAKDGIDALLCSRRWTRRSFEDRRKALGRRATTTCCSRTQTASG